MLAYSPKGFPQRPGATRPRRYMTCMRWALARSSRRASLQVRLCLRGREAQYPVISRPRVRRWRKPRIKRRRRRYALGIETVKPVFVQFKAGRRFRHFLLRGLEKVNREWLLNRAVHDLLKLFPSRAGCPA